MSTDARFATLGAPRRVVHAGDHAGAASNQSGTMTEIDRLLADPAVSHARRILHESDDRTLADQIELVQIPAPPFGEAERGRRMAELFREAGLTAVAVDEVGNVSARLAPASADDAAPFLISAHLDTVFPEGTEVTVKRDGDRFCSPGIADDARGLAALVAIARALRTAGVRTRTPLVFVATVGEEGIGDLRGVKHLFREGSPWRGAAGFISLDGTGCRRIVHRALGSRRFRISVTGVGGHSWADWGIANPIHALGLAIAELTRVPIPSQPRSTLTVARIAGGTSINAIPEEAWIELDLRSEGVAALGDLESATRSALRAAVEACNARRRRGTPALTMSIDVIGDRPSGETPATSVIVRTAIEATLAIGHTPELVASSTDANVPIALGIPAITMGAGGESGGTHTLEEWYSNESGPEGIERALLTTLALTGLS